MTDTVVIRNLDESYIRIDSPTSIAYELSELFTFKAPNYRFTPLYRSGRWNGDIKLFNLSNRTLHRGLAYEVQKYCDQQGYKCLYEGNEKNPLTKEEFDDFLKELNPKYDLYYYQKDAVLQALSEKRIVLLSPTASGKSLIIYTIIRYLMDLGLRGLLVVPTVSLVEQMYSDFADYSVNNGWNCEENLHKIYSGKEKISEKGLYISTWQSIAKLDEKYFSSFDFAIMDEVHQAKAKSLSSIMSKCKNAKYRIGLTGTLDNKTVHTLVIKGLFGRIYKVVTTKELMEKKFLSDFRIRCIVLKHDEISSKYMYKAKYHDELKYLILNKERNTFIRNLALSMENNTLVLFNYLEHGDLLYKSIKTKIKDDRNVYLVNGGTDVEDREQVRSLVENNTNDIIVASVGVFSTGVNIRNLHNIIFASPSKSRIRNLQSIGRGLRLSENKEKATLYDISDDMRYKKYVNFTLNHFEERLKIYRSEKFEFKIFNIDL